MFNPAKNQNYSISLRNLSGVPVLQVFGEINTAAIKAIEKTAGGLIRAGHFNLVLNVEKAAAANAKAFRGLENIVREVRKHYGGVTLVTGLDNAAERISGELLGMFRHYPTEAAALARIKGLPNLQDTENLSSNARLAGSK